jgi:hypothetical protein
MVGRGFFRSSFLVAFFVGVACTCALGGCDSHKPRVTDSVSSASPPSSVDAGAAVREPAAVPIRPPAQEQAKPSSRAADSKACLVLCKIGDELECGTPFPLCVQQCQEMTHIPKCSAEMQAALQCFAQQPTWEWECDTESKMPTVKEGRCGEEQRRVAECIKA